VGLFKNMNDLYKAGGEPLGEGARAKRSDRMANAKSRMAAAQEMMADQTWLMNLAATGTDVSAIVLDARQTTQMINLQPVIELDLQIMADGRPPYPLTLRQPIPQLYLSKVQAGGALRAKVDPADPSAVYLDLASS
jgi:hypothetical protein